VSLSDNLFAMAIAVGVSGLTVEGVSNLIPARTTADFFAVQDVRVDRDGAGAVLWVDRTIKRPVHMVYTVRIMQATPQGWRQFCKAQSNPILYQPDSVLDQPVTLDWWTDGKCAILPEGRTRIMTTWAPLARGLEPVTFTSEVAG